MFAYVARRLILAVFTLWTVTVLSFIIIQLPPGDFVDAYMAQLSATQSNVSEQHFETLRRQYALDRPMHEQYLKWMSGIFRGDFGTSMMWRKSVLDVIGDRLAMTMVLSLGAIILTWGIALPIGIYSAVRQYSIGDYLFTFVGFVGLGVPSFLLALVLMYLGFTLFNSNIGGLFSPEYQLEPWSWGKVKDLIYHLPLPVIIIGLSGTAELIRVMRANLLDELRKPYVITARAAGMSERRLVLKYPVRVALNPFASTIGYLLPYILSGSVIVSVVLSLPTLGPLLLGSLVAQDMFLAGTIVLMLGSLTVIGTFLSDLLLMWIDPRIRFGIAQ
ncbi:MAG: ABC transporter permease [Caldilineaceae bacterium SB0665_bin_25]|nr:ABC transporter permease [Caldilineaceae bacterium SB0665_bin_25]